MALKKLPGGVIVETDGGTTGQWATIRIPATGY